MNLSSMLIDISLKFERHQRDDGSFMAGHNGPYVDPEKPTRNTAHILFLLASVYENNPSDELKVAAERSIEYLLSKELRPASATFYCRDKKGKDSCNGLIGQAWVIEALVKASEVFDREDCYKVAEEVFFLHKWNEDIGIWNRVDIDGSELSVDSTFNHQLWFAAVAAQLNKTAVAQKQALTFLRKIASNVTLYPSGVIFHASPMGSASDYLSHGVLSFASQVKNRLILKRRLRSLYSKSVGYHGFNLYAYAMLKESFPNEKIWNSSLIENIISVVEKPEFQKELIKSDFGYYYNVSGIEIAYAMESLCDDKKKAQAWLNRQFQYTFEDSSHPLTKGVIDKNTAMARLYQAVRLKNDYEILC
ncbi:hypothetical protein NFC81_06535 [Salinispirillum sp. LH 10-3-1]|uniref:Agl cluster protein AglQ n=1 Tax=Salinispirillum sp. LH 10-3-1 TaxID=2952525 RepID=A0AB38YK00_9GAMM